VFEFHKSAIRPQGPLDLGTGHQLSRPAGQEAQQPGRLTLQPDGLSVFMQFACGQVEFEWFEANFLILLKLSHLPPTVHQGNLQFRKISAAVQAAQGRFTSSALLLTSVTRMLAA
jgi:hypothetical protein